MAVAVYNEHAAGMGLEHVLKPAAVDGGGTDALGECPVTGVGYSMLCSAAIKRTLGGAPR
jgi:hypothetical protein